jgi:hypothetical protein
MAIACRDDDPLEALFFARTCMVDTYGRGYWGNFEMTLRPVIEAFVQLGHHRLAAVLLGGLTGLPAGRSDTAELGETLRPRLTEVLGGALEPLLLEGRRLDRRAIARLTIGEIDRLLSRSG